MKLDPKMSEADFKDVVISIAKRYGWLVHHDLLVPVCRPVCRVRLVCVSCSRASLALTRRLRALSSVVVGCVCCRVHVGAFFCLLTVCHLQVNRCVNAPPTRLPILVPFAFSRLCLRLASALCSFHFVLHDSRRADLPSLPSVTNCRANGLGRATSRLFTVLGC